MSALFSLTKPTGQISQLANPLIVKGTLVATIICVTGMITTATPQSHLQYSDRNKMTGSLGIIRNHRRVATPDALWSIKELSGFNWQMLADVFTVSRRAIHHWASGSTLTSANEAKLFEVYDLFQSAPVPLVENNGSEWKKALSKELKIEEEEYCLLYGRVNKDVLISLFIYCIYVW